MERLLELARPARLTFQPVHLPELLDRVLDLYAGQIETRGIEAHREYARDCPPIQADAEYLYQAIVNLVGNALEAMEAGGRLTLRVGWFHGSDPFGPGRGPAWRLKVEVEDTGIGIGADTAGKVFDPFFTTKGAGTGLGLALTHKIVEDHHGRITFSSVPGAGTTFRIVLPVTPGGAPRIRKGQDA